MYIYIFTYTNADCIRLNFHPEKEYDVGACKYICVCIHTYAHLAFVFVELSLF
jgi:hypothetical protein